MTKPTDSRTLRLLIDGILSVYGVDNLELTIKLCEAFKKFYESPEPRRTKDEILASLHKAINTGQAKSDQIQAIAAEINKRTRISPVTKEWQEFVEYAWRKARDKQQTISAFLDWWLSDEWQATHPPSKPDSWYVKWDMAFADKLPAQYQDVAV